MRSRTSLLLVLGLVTAACAPSGTPATAPAPVAAAVRTIDVYKSPTCSCCHEWEAYLRAHGWSVRSMPTDDMAAVKARLDVPQGAWSCHTAVVDGYAIEGHVPLEAIDDLLATRPAIDGIALPGMPPGSPGMPGEQQAPFEVLALDGGATSSFGSY